MAVKKLTNLEFDKQYIVVLYNIKFMLRLGALYLDLVMQNAFIWLIIMISKAQNVDSLSI